MGFFTVVAWVVVVFAILVFFAVVHNYRKFEKRGLGDLYLDTFEFRPSFVWAVIVSICWLGWRYFGA